MKKILLPIVICLFVIESNGQGEGSTTIHKKVYSFNKKSEIPLTLGMFALNFYGFHLLGEKQELNLSQINLLNKNDIWSFDRNVFSQSHPAPSSVYDISDIVLWTAYVAPTLLFLDRDIKENWLDITLLYMETQAINLNIYLWSGPVFTKRVRPLVYIDGASLDYKLGKETTDSFFSGHASMTAGASFFMAKVLSDYHPELGAKKWLLYAAALVPPAVVGYYRYRGFMHFPSDILIGIAVGAAVGISVPHLHKITKNRGISIAPFAGRYNGLAFSMQF